MIKDRYLSFGPYLQQPSTSTLHNHLSIDFIVIGGGLTGLTTAYALARGGHRVTVLEKDNFDNVRRAFHFKVLCKC